VPAPYADDALLNHPCWNEPAGLLRRRRWCRYGARRHPGTLGNTVAAHFPGLASPSPAETRSCPFAPTPPLCWLWQRWSYGVLRYEKASTYKNTKIRFNLKTKVNLYERICSRFRREGCSSSGERGRGAGLVSTCKAARKVLRDTYVRAGGQIESPHDTSYPKNCPSRGWHLFTSLFMCSDLCTCTSKGAPTLESRVPRWSHFPHAPCTN